MGIQLMYYGFGSKNNANSSDSVNLQLSNDIWSMGIIIVELLIKEHPLLHNIKRDAPSNDIAYYLIIEEIDKLLKYPDYLRNLIKEMLKPDPQDRIKTDQILNKQYVWLTRTQKIFFLQNTSDQLANKGVMVTMIHINNQIMASTLEGLKRDSGGIIPLEQLQRIMKQVLIRIIERQGNGDSLRTLHPRNIHISGNDNVSLSELNRGDQVYYSPETLFLLEAGDEEGAFTPKTDVWTFGCILFEAALGYDPIQSGSIDDILNGIFDRFGNPSRTDFWYLSDQRFNILQLHSYATPPPSWNIFLKGTEPPTPLLRGGILSHISSKAIPMLCDVLRGALSFNPKSRQQADQLLELEFFKPRSASILSAPPSPVHRSPIDDSIVIQHSPNLMRTPQSIQQQGSQQFNNSMRSSQRMRPQPIYSSPPNVSPSISSQHSHSHSLNRVQNNTRSMLNRGSMIQNSQYVQGQYGQDQVVQHVHHKTHHHKRRRHRSKGRNSGSGIESYNNNQIGQDGQIEDEEVDDQDEEWDSGNDQDVNQQQQYNDQQQYQQQYQVQQRQSPIQTQISPPIIRRIQSSPQTRINTVYQSPSSIQQQQQQQIQMSPIRSSPSRTSYSPNHIRSPPIQRTSTQSSLQQYNSQQRTIRSPPASSYQVRTSPSPQFHTQGIFQSNGFQSNGLQQGGIINTTIRSQSPPAQQLIQQTKINSHSKTNTSTQRIGNIGQTSIKKVHKRSVHRHRHSTSPPAGSIISQNYNQDVNGQGQGYYTNQSIPYSSSSFQQQQQQQQYNISQTSPSFLKPPLSPRMHSPSPAYKLPNRKRNPQPEQGLPQGDEQLAMDTNGQSIRPWNSQFGEVDQNEYLIQHGIDPYQQNVVEEEEEEEEFEEEEEEWSSGGQQGQGQQQGQIITTSNTYQQPQQYQTIQSMQYSQPQSRRIVPPVQRTYSPPRQQSNFYSEQSSSSSSESSSQSGIGSQSRIQIHPPQLSSIRRSPNLYSNSNINRRSPLPSIKSNQSNLSIIQGGNNTGGTIVNEWEEDGGRKHVREETFEEAGDGYQRKEFKRTTKTRGQRGDNINTINSNTMPINGYVTNMSIVSQPASIIAYQSPSRQYGQSINMSDQVQAYQQEVIEEEEEEDEENEKLEETYEEVDGQGQGFSQLEKSSHHSVRRSPPRSSFNNSGTNNIGVSVHTINTLPSQNPPGLLSSLPSNNINIDSGDQYEYSQQKNIRNSVRRSKRSGPGSISPMQSASTKKPGNVLRTPQQYDGINGQIINDQAPVYVGSQQLYSQNADVPTGVRGVSTPLRGTGQGVGGTPRQPSTGFPGIFGRSNQVNQQQAVSGGQRSQFTTPQSINTQLSTPSRISQRSPTLRNPNSPHATPPVPLRSPPRTTPH
ncbi:MAG: hypothetical protein EZS28_004455 [Streblomastix strix]|uniref:Protein kinase domain-containing protein n=1 Tax=Streblomastix strix TaxID=222440 RepID=A0A5J4WYV6_9EUKA|nr:MAG: hypothetical protein EZS28_004455 [Streblomastix strix]